MSLVGAQRQINADAPLVRVRRWKLPDAGLTMPVSRVLALLAGPRKGGNTDCVMDALLSGVQSAGAVVEKYAFPDLGIAPCSGCMACESQALPDFCAIRDGMTDIYEKFLEYDAFVMGFPVYTARECSQAAIIFDRLKALRNKGQYNKPGKIRKGALVVTWGWPSDNAYSHVVENAAFILKLFGVETVEIVTASGFWDAYYKKGAARLDTAGMAQAREAGATLVTG
jgi:multimeric flavodoxin WrbA